jgi:uncharacterized repeat protein (TIGR03833 family)
VIKKKTEITKIFLTSLIMRERERDVQNPCKRRDINAGMHVRIVEKKNQKEGITTDGIVARILTNSSEHPHGIKVQLSNGAVGRVKEIMSKR